MGSIIPCLSAMYAPIMEPVKKHMSRISMKLGVILDIETSEIMVNAQERRAVFNPTNKCCEPAFLPTKYEDAVAPKTYISIDISEREMLLVFEVSSNQKYMEPKLIIAPAK